MTLILDPKYICRFTTTISLYHQNWSCKCEKCLSGSVAKTKSEDKTGAIRYADNSLSKVLPSKPIGPLLFREIKTPDLKSKHGHWPPKS